jgi:hypothetical protein
VHGVGKPHTHSHAAAVEQRYDRIRVEADHSSNDTSSGGGMGGCCLPSGMKGTP